MATIALQIRILSVPTRFQHSNQHQTNDPRAPESEEQGYREESALASRQNPKNKLAESTKCQQRSTNIFGFHLQ